jgi:hypothetical protein
MRVTALQVAMHIEFLYRVKHAQRAISTVMSGKEIIPLSEVDPSRVVTTELLKASWTAHAYRPSGFSQSGVGYS